MDDHQLLSAYFDGDEQAFETLVEKYFQMVYTVAARQTRDSHLAEEIAQSVFIILSRKAPGLSDKTSIPGWLIRTTRFVCRDAIKMRFRRGQNERKLAMDLEHQSEARPGPSTMELLLDEAIRSLQPDEQAGIVARFFEGRNFQEIAEMFAITEEAARKRTSRCLAKLEAFMTKRGARVTAQTLSGLLLTPHALEPTRLALQSAIHATHAAWKGKFAAANVVALANHTIRLLRWRFMAGLGLRFALPVLVVFLGIWATRQLNQPPPDPLERLGMAWGALDQMVAQHRQFLIQTPPNSPNYQAKVQQDLAAISRESIRLISEVNPLLTAPGERIRFAKFLTAELDSTLKLNAREKAALLSYIQNRLTAGATLNEAMRAVAQSAQLEATDIKAMLSPAQQRRFDQIYGADGVLLFSYAKVIALGQIGG